MAGTRLGVGICGPNRQALCTFVLHHQVQKLEDKSEYLAWRQSSILTEGCHTRTYGGYRVGYSLMLFHEKNDRAYSSVRILMIHININGDLHAYLILVRTVIDAAQTTGNSKLRILFDSSDSRTSIPHKTGNTTNLPTTTNANDMFGLHSPSRSPASNNYSVAGNFPIAAFTPRMNSSPRLFGPQTHAQTHTPTAAQSSSAAGRGPGLGLGLGLSGCATPLSAVVGDVGEPFWIQLSHPLRAHAHTLSQTKSDVLGAPSLLVMESGIRGGDCSKDSMAHGYSCWSDPDDLSTAEIKKFISEGDKRVFWEMAKAIIDLPEISDFSNSGIKNAKDLALILKKPEYKVLWTANGADILPRQAAAELVTAAYAEL